jgi:Leucine-rich repeat (LRR) protein
MKPIYILAAILTLLPVLVKAQKTYVPDNNFEQFLINWGYDHELDNYVETSHITGITLLSIDKRNIASLTGIQDFESLEKLFCSGNLLTKLDLSSNKKLYSVICDSNQLTSFDVGDNPALVTISCNYNMLTSLDLKNCKALENLLCEKNQLTVLDVSANKSLKIMYCQNNLLAGLNVSTGSLKELYCRGNQLASLYLKATGNLERLDCQDNRLTSLDVSGNRKLNRLWCNNNLITSLNVSANPALKLFYCPGNRLTSLNLKNGNNANLNGGLPGVIVVMAINNPNLTCIQVDDPAAALGYTWRKDASATYSADCGYEDLAGSMAYIPDDQFEQSLIDYGFDNGPLNDSVAKAAIDTVLTLDVSGKEIEDLTGINDFSALEELDCSHNKLTTIQAEQVNPLTWLYCLDNQISHLDLSGKSSLTYLNCSFNQLPTFHVFPYTPLKSMDDGGSGPAGLIVNAGATLKEFYCQGNQFTSLDAGGISTLEKLDCRDNRLTALNLKNGNNTALTVMNATGNPDLKCIQVDDPAAANGFAGWSKDPGARYSAGCGYTGIPDSLVFNGNDELVIFPNPSAGQIRIKHPRFRDSGGLLEIFDATGKKCLEKPIPPGNEEISADIGILINGLYFCKIRSGDTCLARRIIVY